MKQIFGAIWHFLGKPLSWFRALSRKKKLFIIVLLLVIILIVGKSLKDRNGKKYATAPVTRNNLAEVVTETGTVTLVGQTDIFSPANGIVSSISVANGDSVTEGQELFTVNSTATDQEVQAAYANYLTALATLNAANANSFSLRSDMFDAWDTYYNLATGDLYENSDGTPKNAQRALPEFHIAKDDWLAAEKNYKDQQTVVAKAQASVASTLLLYQATQDAKIKATASGTVVNLAVTNGSTVSVKSTTNTTPVLTITTPSAIELKIPLTESDSVKVAGGQKATVELNAFADKKFQGLVDRVDTIGTDIQGVVRYNAYIKLTDRDDRIKPGMSVDVEIITQELTDELSVPNAAVKPYQGGRAVRVLDEKGEIKYLPVQIGIKSPERTQIISGVSEGTEVITALSNEQIKRSLFGN